MTRLRLPARWPYGAAAALLSDGRLHLQHGPIDLIITAEGTMPARRAAFSAALEPFVSVIEGLVADLPRLRSASPQSWTSGGARGPVSARMIEAITPLAARHFVTPMAAVAGAVADHMAEAIAGAAALDRLIVNDGGDIALRLSEGHGMRLMLCTDPEPGAPRAAGSVEITAASGIRGVATSGWRGRSHSLGIADAVTVFATNAAQADVAATLIANAVDLPGDPRLAPYVERRPATALSPDSDLGDRLVTVKVDRLPAELAISALTNGRAEAERLATTGLIAGAYLTLGPDTASAGTPPPIRSTATGDGRRLAGGRSGAWGASPLPRERAPVRQAHDPTIAR
ncbi:MAG: UPF0280 family protein [Pseudomonadota bacterium]